MKILQTQRTIVSRIALSDAAFFLRLLNSPDWKRYIGDRQVNSVDDVECYLENAFLSAYATYGFGYYLVRTRDSVPLGICGFLKKDHLEYPDFGFAILPEFYGQGLAFESSEAVLSYGIEEFGLNTIEAEVQKNNNRSIRLLERLGFQLVSDPSTGDNTLLYQMRQTPLR